MNELKQAAKTIVTKYGNIIAACAFAIITVSANSPCVFAFYEPKEPAGLDKYKRFNK